LRIKTKNTIQNSCPVLSLKKYNMVWLFALLVFQATAQTTGPEKGTLMIVGGGPATPLIQQFVEIAGGKNANIVVIPTAGTAEEFGPDWYFRRVVEESGANSLTVLHTRNPQESDSDKFIAPLKEATGIWFTGGRQWRLVDAYQGTQVVDECFELLNRGGIIGGSSAGATIQGSYLARGDTASNAVMMGSHQKGFGFITNVAIDQHLLARNRQFDMFEILKQHPQLLGIGIDESTAIVVKNDTFEVVGPSYVAIYDGKFWRRDNNPVVPPQPTFYLLKAGDKYDLKTREVIK
jgi:cyanophycinase